MNSFRQLTGTKMDSRNMDTSASPGYDADDDMAVGDNSVSSADECEESTPNNKCRPSLLMRVPCRRKRRRHEKRSQRPRFSIVHPDIDVSLTTHIVAGRQPQHRKPTASSEPHPPLSLHTLSHLLEDYFQQQHANYKAPAPVSDEDCLTPEQVSFSEFSSSRRSSEQCLFLEDALGFSSHARVLVEASPLHRVVHANAAYNSLTAKKEPLQNASAIRVQERFRMPSISLESVVSAMFADDRPVTVYPVQDSDTSGVIRYYLVEHIAALTRLANIAEPAQTRPSLCVLRDKYSRYMVHRTLFQEPENI
jgi:hypothetical protein